MERRLKISIITPSFNQGPYITENIQSVLHQNYDNFEHIVIDGGSTDNTIEILKQYPNLKWISEKDRGQSHALNKGLALAGGDIIGWINSDDYLCPNAFNAINRFFINNHDNFVVTGNLLMVDQNSVFLKRSNANLIEYNKLLNGGQCVQQPSTFFRSEVLAKTGNIDESFHYTMDHELFIRIARHYKFSIIDEDLACFRRYNDSKTGSAQLKFVKETFRYKRKHHAQLITYNNFRLLLRFVKEPLKKITWLKSFVRILRGVDPNYI